MLFRDRSMNLVDIKKLSYTCDGDYYRAIIEAKKINVPSKTHDEHRRMLNAIHTNYIPK